MDTPIYRSLAESFRLNLYLPDGGLAAPPTATYRADGHLKEAMSKDRPPQSVLIDLADGVREDELEGALRMLKGRAVPVIRFEHSSVQEDLIALAKRNNLGDMTLCVPYEMRHILKPVRDALPLSRGMLDMRACHTPDLIELVGQCQTSEATMLLMRADVDRTLIRRLKKRFIQVWVEENGNLAQAVLTGACGVLTQRTDELYDLFKRFPDGSAPVAPPLYAHKTWHVTGEYPENSVKGCMAAGRLGFDSAEIDVQLTRDDVMVVHHDRHTKNLFTENRTVYETDWEELKALRRKAFPEDGLDKMEDLMVRMAEFPETPVLIEIKTPADTFGVEEMVRQLKALLAREDVQKACTLIMGVMPPYLSYVHEQLPQIPAAHCTYVKEHLATDSVDENNLRLYGFAMETRGANAGFNPYHPMVGRTFARLAHARGITVFPWTWAFEPWEQCREAITDCYLQGFDGLTSDWVGKFYHVPVDVRAKLPEKWPAGQPLAAEAEVLTRAGSWISAEQGVQIIPLDEGAQADGAGSVIGRTGKGRVAVGVWTELEGGKRVCVVSRAYDIDFV